MIIKDMWYKNAIIYSLDVETFMDGNADGIGDFGGLLKRLEALASLGVTCIWLMPFYASPNRDNGYDVKDYYSVDPRLGTLGEFVEFVHQARQYGIRVIVDLVVNHTSSEHPWFQAALEGPDSKYHDYYIWSKEKPENIEDGVVFPGQQHSVWTYAEQVDAWYFHRFYEHQPDLNIDNPAVLKEIRQIMGFWLQLGVSGFRIDAAPFLIELRQQDSPDFAMKYEYLKDFRQFLSWRQGDAIMLAEANVSPDKVSNYFSDGDQFHMLFHFMLNQYLYLGLIRQDADCIRKAIEAVPSLPDAGQWAIFLRNHDELSLDKLTEEERQEVFDALGPDETMQIFDRGLRRRLAPLLSNDRRRLELFNSLLFTLPGTPVIYYGQEIGMGEDLSQKGRSSVRTPMQWSREQNAGFSAAPRDQLIRPVIEEGEYRYEEVNVADQSRDEHSLLNWMKKIIRARKECPEFGFGRFEMMDFDEPGIFAHRCWTEEGEVMALHNLTDKEVTIRLDFDSEVRHVIDVLGDRLFEPEEGSSEIDLGEYGYHWLRVVRKGVL